MGLCSGRRENVIMHGGSCTFKKTSGKCAPAAQAVAGSRIAERGPATVDTISSTRHPNETTTRLHHFASCRCSFCQNQVGSQWQTDTGCKLDRRNQPTGTNSALLLFHSAFLCRVQPSTIAHEFVAAAMRQSPVGVQL